MSEREIDAPILLEFYCTVTRDATHGGGKPQGMVYSYGPGTRVYETKLPGKLIHGQGGAFRTV